MALAIILKLHDNIIENLAGPAHYPAGDLRKVYFRSIVTFFSVSNDVNGDAMAQCVSSVLHTYRPK